MMCSVNAVCPTDLADRFALVIRRLLEVIGMQGIGNAMAGPLILLLGRRINALGKRFACLAEQVRAGTLPPSRVRGAATLRRASVPRLAVPRRPFPNALGWLYR